MSEKLCLQWNDFKDNAIGAFGSLRDDKDFADVTLACDLGCFLSFLPETAWKKQTYALGCSKKKKNLNFASLS